VATEKLHKICAVLRGEYILYGITSYVLAEKIQKLYLLDKCSGKYCALLPDLEVRSLHKADVCLWVAQRRRWRKNLSWPEIDQTKLNPAQIIMTDNSLCEDFGGRNTGISDVPAVLRQKEQNSIA